MPEISRLPRPIAFLWEWQYSGACRDLPTEMFFKPDRLRGTSRHRHESAAKAVCSTCAVIEQCRNHALTVQERYGVWGGLTEDERLAILENKLDKKIPYAS